MTDNRLAKQMAFIIEIDKLKSITRQCTLMNGKRYENDVEHSWHLAIMAILLSEYAAENVELIRVIKMVLIHDIVEIDAGDTYIYDSRAGEDKEVREIAAADRIFALLPEDQALEMRQLWDEFEARESPEARFAAALDRIHPMIHNYMSKGASWKKHSISSDMVIAKNGHAKDGAPALWEYALELIHDAVDKGYLLPAEPKK
ncbi:MAG: HD domain-containing protein [bacterium]|nr:HD domain-containing protein [bacterium]